MGIKINDILLELDGYPLRLFSGDGSAEITGLAGFPDGEWEANRLYVLRGPEIFRSAPPRPGSCLLCAAAGELPTGLIGDGTINVLQLRDETALPALLRDIERCLADELFVASHSVRIFEALLRRRTPQAVMDAANEALDLPMVAADLTNVLFAHTCDPELYGEADWDGFVKTGVVPSFLSDGGSRIVKDVCETPFGVFRLTENLLTGGLNLITDLVFEGRRVGRLALRLPGREPSGPELRILSAMAEALANAVGKSDDLHFTKGSITEAFLLKLIEGGPAVPEFLQSAGRSLNYPEEGFFRVLVFDLEEHRPFERPIQSVISYLEMLCPGSISVVSERRLVMLTNYQSARAFEGRDEAELGKFLRDFRVHCGAGRVFTRLDAFSEGYSEAQNAMEISRYINGVSAEAEDFRLSLYEERESYIEAMALYKSGRDPGQKAHPAVLALRDYDESYRTSYYETLRVYLDCALKTQAAAQKLCIHRNSLEYRLRKIKGITGIDWENGDLMTRLHRSFILLDFLEMAKARERLLRSAAPTGF